MSRIIDRGLEDQIVLLAKMGELTYETLGISLHGYLDGRSVEPSGKRTIRPSYCNGKQS